MSLSLRNLLTSALLTSLTGFAAGCGSDAPPADCTLYAWEPGVGDLSSFPTSDFLHADETSPNGYRVGYDESVDLTSYGPLATLFTEQARDLDGVTVQGEFWLGFSQPLDPARLPAATGVADPDDGAGIVVIPDDGAPYLVPVELQANEDILYIRPLFPLPEQTKVAYFAGEGLTEAAGGCFEPVGFMRRALRRPDANRQEAIDALISLGVIEEGRDLVALHPAKTQSVTVEDRAIAARIETLDSELSSISCTDEGTHRRCEAQLMVEDYRADDGAVTIDVDDVRAQKMWAVPVSIWLPPASVTGPYPTFIYGHGITDRRQSAGFIGEPFAANGWATVAIDALVHGEHPSSEGEMLDGAAATFRFFALDLGALQFDARRLRGHWRQSALDKLQLVRALARVGDLDGDGTRDADMSALGYFGISLGGIMSTELVALSDAFSLVVNWLGGGTYARIVYDEATYAPLLRLILRGQGVNENGIRQSFAAMQGILDRGDGTAYARHVLEARFDASSAIPDYFFGIALDDDTVPNNSNYSLARGLGIGIAPELIRPEPGMERLTAGADGISANYAGGRATAGLLQFDVVEDSVEGRVLATHMNVPQSQVGRTAAEHFVQSHIDDGIATIIDPYIEIGLPHGLPAP